MDTEICYKSLLLPGPNPLFRQTFRESEVAKPFSLSKIECKYYVHCGLAPYFKEGFIKPVEASSDFSLSFDETLNGELQKEMMIEKKYAQDTFKVILDLLLYLLSELLPRHMIQLSIDGPIQNERY